MAETQRRRFPLIELLAITALAVSMMIAICAFELLPHGLEIWIDLESLHVEHRWQVCGLCTGITREEYYNDVANYYAATGIEFGEPNWVKSSTMYWWLRYPYPIYNSMFDVNPQIPGFEYALFLMSEFTGIDHQPQGWQSRVNMSQSAREKLMRSFLFLVRDNREDTILVRDYATATSHRFRELGFSVDVADIIPVDTWLADPVPKHYYGPDKIH